MHHAHQRTPFTWTMMQRQPGDSSLSWQGTHSLKLQSSTCELPTGATSSCTPPGFAYFLVSVWTSLPL